MAQRDGGDWRRIARDHVNARNIQPTIDRFRGDPKLAAGYLPFAQAVLGDLDHRLTLGGIEQGARQIQLADGAVVRVVRNGAIRIIEIDASRIHRADELWQTLFLESGFLDVQPLVPYGTPKPAAKVYPTQAVFAEHAKGEKVLRWLDEVQINPVSMALRQGDLRDYVAEMDSLAVNSSLEEDDPDDFRDGRFVRKPTSDKRYGMLNNVMMAHFATTTGKMKLWAQCRMGVESTDNVMVGSFVNGDIYKYMTGKFFSHQSLTFSHGLYTTDDFIYYYLTLRNGILSARRCVFVKRIGGLVRCLQTKKRRADTLTDEQLYKIESYVLSQMTLDESDTKPRYREVALNAAPFEILGEPVAYGWKFNWKGDRCSIVTTEYSYTPSFHNVNRLYTISIEEGVRGGIRAPVNATIELVEEIPCTPRANVDITWFPNPFYFPMMYYHHWVPCDQHLEHADYIYDTEAPIYCWYGTTSPLNTDYYLGTGEQLIVVRFKLEEVPKPLDTEVPTFCGPTVVVEGEAQAADYGWNVEKGGFYLNAYDDPPEDRLGIGQNVIHYRWDVHEGESQQGNDYNHLAGITVPCVVNRPPSADPGSQWVLSNRYGVAGTAMKETWNGQYLYESALIIPWDSSESIYFAKLAGIRKMNYYKSDYILNGHPASYGMSNYCLNQPEYFEFSAIRFDLINWWWSPPGGNVTEESGDWYVVNLQHQRYAKHGKQMLLDEELQWGSRIVYVYRPYSEVTDTVARPEKVANYDDVFDPIVCGGSLPILTSSYLNLESVLGVGIYKSAEPDFGTDEETQVTDANLPEDGADFNAMFVGWV